MVNTNAQGLEQASQGECHGRENSLTRKLSPLLHLPSSMVQNGSKCNYQYYIPFFKKCYKRFLGEIPMFSPIFKSPPPYRVLVRVGLVGFTQTLIKSNFAVEL
jgi:hypothetical protein